MVRQRLLMPNALNLMCEMRMCMHCTALHGLAWVIELVPMAAGAGA